MESAKQVKKKKIGLWILTALVAGNMIGSGIFLLPSSLAHFGSIGLVAWILTSIGAILLALIFAHLSRMIPKVGGPYAYCYAGFGEFIGFQVAYNYWIAIWVGNAAIVVAFIGYLSVFWPGLIGRHDLAFVVSLAVIWFLTAVNILSVRQAGILQLVTTVLKLLPLLLIIGAGFYFIHPQNFGAFNVSGKPALSALTAAAALTLWAFIGLESATVPADAVENPEKNMSKATILGTVIAAVIYILSTVVIMGIIPMKVLGQSAAPFADAGRIMFGHWGGWILGAGAAIACFGALNGWILLQGQIPMAAARDCLFPRVFEIETLRGTPVVGLVVSSIFMSLLLLLTLRVDLIDQFTFIILLATLASLIPYLFTTMAELILLFNYREHFSPKRFGISVSIAILGGIYAFWMIIGAGKEVVYYGAMLMFSGIPVYVWIKWREHCRERAKAEVDAVLGMSEDR